MVKKKTEEKTIMQQLQEQSERYEMQNPVIKTAWSVEEVTPGYNTGGYYDQDIPEESKIVSPEFETEAEADTWVDEHVADKGKHLRVVRYRLRQHTYRKWHRG